MLTNTLMNYTHEITVEDKQIIFYNHFCFYGTEASEELGKMITKQAENIWNEAKAVVTIDNQLLPIRFIFDFTINQLLTPEILKENIHPYNKFFRIEKAHKGNISFVDDIKSNSGFLVKKNVDTETSTTFAHELGHCYGLWHPKELDLRDQDTPPHLMYPRGTLVQPKFQYKQDKKVYVENGKLVVEEGATLNPIYRTAQQINIDEMKIETAYKKFGKNFSISKITNTYHTIDG